MRTTRRAHDPLVAAVLALTLLGGCGSPSDDGQGESPLAQVCGDLLAGNWPALADASIPSGEKELGDAVEHVEGWMNDPNTGYMKLVSADFQAARALESLDTAWVRCETVDGFPELGSPEHGVISDEVDAHVRSFNYGQ